MHSLKCRKTPSTLEEGDWWEMHAECAISQQHCGVQSCMVMLTTLEGFLLYYAQEYGFKASNNEVEYEAVLGGLRLAKALKVCKVRIKTDSRLVVRQVTRICEAKNERFHRYKEVTKGLLRELEAYMLEYVPRADYLKFSVR